MKLTGWTVVGASLMVAIWASVLRAQGGSTPVAYPEGYREWTHVKTMVIQQGHPLFDAFGGIHHIYANEQALEGYKSGKSFPEGSIIVFDLLEAPASNGAVTEGPRKVVAVMHRAARFGATGGWGFEAFKGDSRDRVVKDAAKECFACHKADAPGDFVFSTWRK